MQANPESRILCHNFQVYAFIGLDLENQGVAAQSRFFEQRRGIRLEVHGNSRGFFAHSFAGAQIKRYVLPALTVYKKFKRCVCLDRGSGGDIWFFMVTSVLTNN